jgi:hypothetical protein
MLLPLDPHRNAFVPSSRSSRATPLCQLTGASCRRKTTLCTEARSVPGWALDSKLPATRVGPLCCPRLSPGPEGLGSVRGWRPRRRFAAVQRQWLYDSARTALPRCVSCSGPKTFAGVTPWRDSPDLTPSPKQRCVAKLGLVPYPDYSDALASEETSTSPCLRPTRVPKHSRPPRPFCYLPRRASTFWSRRILLGSRFPRCRSTAVHPSRAPHHLASHASALDLDPQTDTPHRDRHPVRIRPKPSSSELPAARSPTPPAPPVAELDVQRFSRGAANFKALLHRRVRSVPMPFPASVRPILPWA